MFFRVMLRELGNLRLRVPARQTKIDHMQLRLARSQLLGETLPSVLKSRAEDVRVAEHDDVLPLG